MQLRHCCFSLCRIALKALFLVSNFNLIDHIQKDWIEVTDIIEDADTLLKIDCIKFDENKISKDLFNNILKDKKVIYVKNQD